MSGRHRARRLALQALCCLDVQGEAAGELVRQFIDDSKEQPATLAAAHEMLKAALQQRAECDELLTRHAKHWDLSRLALVDRNILRLAVAEFRGKEVPPKVVITEAIRLAKEFSTADSPRFVNGVLDAVMKEMTGTEEIGNPPIRAAEQPNSEIRNPKSDAAPNSELPNLPTGRQAPN